MRYLLPLLLAVLMQAGPAVAQSSGYLYIESEPSRPFYLRTHDSLYSSSTGNYLILAPLRNMVGEIIVGFPGSPAALSFTLKDTSVEQGLVLRDLKEEGWRLYDFQKNELVNVRRLGRQAGELKGLARRNDAFAVRLSQVVNDTIILYYKPAVLPQVKVEDQPKPVTVKEAEPVPPPSAVPSMGVRRISKLDLGTKWSLLYEVVEGGQADTIKVEIDKPAKGKKPVKRKAPVKGRKPVKAAAILIFPGRPVVLFSYHEQVFYRSKLPGNKLCRVSKAGECTYRTG